jgi:hypothetical protein
MAYKAKLFFYVYNAGVLFQRKILLKTILKVTEGGYSTKEVTKVFLDKNNN